MVSVEQISIGPNSGPFLCLVNPSSGKGAGSKVAEQLKPFERKGLLKVAITNSRQHTEYLAEQAAADDIKTLVAIGGDGSVHTVANCCLAHNLCLGIIPVGSGNGIARHFKIPMQTRSAIQTLFIGHERSVDVLKTGDKHIIGFAGFGFDAEVATAFDVNGRRGFFQYALIAARQIGSLQTRRYELQHDQTNTEIQAQMLTISNLSQFGNNAFINRTGSDHDGRVELIALNPTNLFQKAECTWRLFQSSLAKSNAAKVYSAANFTIKNPEGAAWHLDGEPAGNPLELTFETIKQALRVISPTP